MAKYGIKYEEDYDGSRIPTCYAASIESIYSSNYYKMALNYADDDNKEFYTKQAAYIERVRQEWIDKANKQKPYDIFICYKDSDSTNGNKHTVDSDDCLELHSYLTDKGYRVFFSRISLSGQGGEKYEPYIFNALATAKVMIVYGSKLEYITAPWVKNEWTRYGKRILSGEKNANSLLLAYKDLNVGDLPAALRSRQCFDATGKRFYSDLTDTIEKIIQDSPTKRSSVENPQSSYSNGLSHTLDTLDNTCEINGIGTCIDTMITIPQMLSGYPVKIISENAFRNCTSITGISIPYGITKIGRLAFGNCTCLKKIALPKSLETIENWAFESCNSLATILLPENLISIGEGAFDLCKNLTNIDYSGTKKQWKKINLHKNWNIQSSIKTVSCTNGIIRIK